MRTGIPPPRLAVASARLLVRLVLFLFLFSASFAEYDDARDVIRVIVVSSVLVGIDFALGADSRKRKRPDQHV